jgi:hypothetical protein
MRFVHCLLFTVYALGFSPAILLGQIQDNSFLLEEAYNQETGVVQHISAFSMASGSDWDYAFTQEWPLGGIRHQLSYTIPVTRSSAAGTGLGDMLLNYRYQLAGSPQAQVVSAPRLSVIIPTGDSDLGRGSGGFGIQVNLPLTLVLGSQFVTHWNAGVTLIPSAQNPAGAEATATGFNLGASVIWLFRPSVNFLVETLWLSDQAVVGEGATLREETTALSPGLRLAFDLAGDLQIVPGVAYTVYLAPSEADDQAFVYLSFEHPFKRQ